MHPLPTTSARYARRLINNQKALEKSKSLILYEKRSLQTGEWTTPIVADYGMDASSANSIAESEDIVNTSVKKEATNLSSAGVQFPKRLTETLAASGTIIRPFP